MLVHLNIKNNDMEQLKIEIIVKVMQYDELSIADKELIDFAKKATYNSYANYSHFYVGAALRLDNHEIQIGANQENAAFPSGLCAERSAIFAAQSTHPEHSIDVLAIAARNDKEFIPTPITPCGACRQVILEMEDRYKKPIRILLFGERRIYQLESIKDLLPLSFVDNNMNF